VFSLKSGSNSGSAVPLDLLRIQGFFSILTWGTVVPEQWRVEGWGRERGAGTGHPKQGSS